MVATRQHHSNSEFKTHQITVEPPEKTSAGHGISGDQSKHRPEELTAGLLYCVCSFSMILTNKLLASSFEFDAPNAMLLCQFVMTVLLIEVSAKLGLVQRDPLDWKVVKLWWPLNMIFVAMIGTGFYALKTLQVPMVTLLKNLSNLMAIVGDLCFFGKRYSVGVWISLGLMSLSAFCGSITDLSFHPVGYTWQISNCVCTAGYALYLKGVLNRIPEVAPKGAGLSDIMKVYYNHLLGLPWLILLIFAVGEAGIVMHQPAVKNPWFLLALLFSGVAGFAVSYSSIRFMSATTSTTYVMTGSLNKIPTAILGWLVFRVHTSVANVMSVLVGLLSGVVFVRAKAAERK